jgi:transketolase
MSIYPLKEKFESFNFNVIEIDGHNYSQIQAVYTTFINNHKAGCGKPTVIIAHTIMGKGVSFMEDDYRWHGIAPKPDEAEKALLELV